MNESNLISKDRNFTHVLQDDGVSYGDYLEQITYLLFLKMADEMSRPPYNKNIHFPKIKDTEGRELPEGECCDWPTRTTCPTPIFLPVKSLKTSKADWRASKRLWKRSTESARKNN